MNYKSKLLLFNNFPDFFTFLKCQICQAPVKCIHGDGYKNCCMVMLFYVLFLKSQELKTNQLKYRLIAVTPIPRYQKINLAVLNHWCHTQPNKSEYKIFTAFLLEVRFSKCSGSSFAAAGP